MQSQWFGTVGYMVIFFGILYFLMIRPQQRQQKTRREMLSGVRANDQVVTVGGIHGKVMRVKEDRVILRIADKVEIEIEKSGIGSVIRSAAERADRQEEQGE